MFCPNDECPDFLNTGLRSEYRVDIERCPYCETPLVSEAPRVVLPDDGEPLKPRVGNDETIQIGNNDTVSRNARTTAGSYRPCFVS